MSFMVNIDEQVHNLSVASKFITPDGVLLGGGGGGGVTSVDMTGGTTGLNVTGGPITDAGTLILGGTLLPDNGGTGLSGIGKSGEVLTVDGTNLKYAPLVASTLKAAGDPKDIQLAGSSEDFVSASTLPTVGVFTYTPTNTPTGDNTQPAYVTMSGILRLQNSNTPLTTGNIMIDTIMADDTNTAPLQTAKSNISIGVRSVPKDGHGKITAFTGEQSGQANIAIGYQTAQNKQTNGFNIAIGTNAGGGAIKATNSSQKGSCIAIGHDAAVRGQGENAIAIGTEAGAVSDAAHQNTGCVAIGPWAGSQKQDGISIIINAATNSSEAIPTDGGISGCFISPIRPEPPTAADAAVYYDTDTKELRYSTTKLFIIPHPTVEGKMLRHACIEAPTRGTNLYEYQINVETDNASTVISLPEYFSSLNRRHRVYVASKNILSTCCGSVNEAGTHAIIQTEKAGIFNVMITGVRKDIGAVQYSATEYIDDPIDLKDIPRTETVILERSGPSVT